LVVRRSRNFSGMVLDAIGGAPLNDKYSLRIRRSAA
jgi:hypothetical protein